MFLNYKYNCNIIFCLFVFQKEKKDEPNVRRPFDREVDLQSNRFDDAQRQSIIKKSRDLNTKFSKGKFTSQFL